MRAAETAGAGLRALGAILSETALPPRRPKRRGRETVEGISERVEIVRDRWGVPHCFAASAADALFALGYVHAQDRPWQMHWSRSAANGRVSEIVGRRGLPADRLTRTLGLAGISEEAWAATAEDERAEVAPYLAGLNAGIARTPRPFEARLLGAPIPPWRAEDSIAWSKLLSFLLGTAWEQQIARARIAAAHGWEALAEIDPPLPPDSRTVSPAEDSLGGPADPLGESVAALRAALGINGGASNNWAIAGRHTQSGAAILACDPHLNPVAPPHAYFAHLSCPEFNAAGATIPGMPGIIWGHNDRIAWGPTASMQAAHIAVVEEIVDGSATRTADGRAPLAASEEEIRVRGGMPETLTVRRSIHGPIVSGQLGRPDRTGWPGRGRAIALDSQVLRPAHSGAAIARLLRADGWDSFSDALAEMADFNLCFGYADLGGRVGARVSGRVARGSPEMLRLPAAGWLEPGEGGPPGGTIGADEQPWVLDPPSGVAASANNPLTPAGDAQFGAEYVDSARAGRIRELIAASTVQRTDAAAGGGPTRRRHAREDSAAIQLDLVDPRLFEFAQRMLEHAGSAGRGRRLLDLIADWDGSMTEESTAAAIVACAAVEYRRAALQEALGDDAGTLAGATAISTLDAFSARAGSWALNRIDADPGRAERELAAALRAAEAALRRQLGPEPAGWRWGRCRELTLRHAFSEAPLIGQWLSAGPFPYGGTSDTVNQSGVLGLDAFAPPAAAPALRLIVELADPPEAEFALAGEQAADALRPTGPMTDAWLHGRRFPLLRDRAAIEAAGRSRLLALEPAPSAREPSVD